jgi:serine/threonine-protein kinase
VATPCLSCAVEVPPGARFCPGCGSPADLESTPTGTAPRPSPRPVPRTPRTGSASGGSSAARVSSDPAGEARFLPGTVLLERYRIVGLLGRGGMGEVYRADDVKLGQAVALKFLPESLAADADRRDRFYNEVRTARQVTHPAVCRVHDIGEVDGQLFLSMEYVDGEDLGSLLRRIGRLPPDKALEIARQVCAGLAAAHDRGVLHRDLKPDNVMIDGRGHARITDFGLAGLAAAIEGADVRSGTPAYMAPEQLAGREVTTRSDVYALGLVLYELFTGRRAFSGRTLLELKRQHLEETPASPSTIVDGLDPAIEAVLLRCLEKDPADRPSSALAVAAALPGGDPLAAALAAGETPSPEMVAALAAAEGLGPRPAVLCLLLAVAAFVTVPLLAPRVQLPAIVPFDRSPAALEDRARELVQRLGHPPPADEASGWGLDMDYLQYVERTDRSPGRWSGIQDAQPPLVVFWHRGSPRYLVTPHTSGRVYLNQPPMSVSGMTMLQLDTRGRLVMFTAVPSQLEEGAGPTSPPDWKVGFDLAGLEFASFKPVTPRWVPDTYADTRAAWEGPYGKRADITIRVEAAAHRGRVTWFEIIGPWARPARMQPFRLSGRQNLGHQFGIVLFLGVALLAGLLARRHLQLGRGDRRGAFRLATFVWFVGMLGWALEAHHVPDLIGQLNIVLRGVADCLLTAGLIWLLYIALEPFVRRRWPRALVSWTRLLAGRVSDPLVARDVLIGVGGGAAMAILLYVGDSLPWAFGMAPAPWWWVDLDPLLGPAYAVAEVAKRQVGAVGFGLAFLLLLLLLRTLLRSEWAAVAVLVTLLAAQSALFSPVPWYIVLPVAALIRLIPLGITLRFGVLATIVCLYVATLLFQLPLSHRLTGWTATPAWCVYAVVAALAAHGFRHATRGWRLDLGD